MSPSTAITATARPRGDLLLGAACALAALGIGLIAGTAAGHRLLAPVGGVALFLALVWDIRLVVPLLIVLIPFGLKFEMGFGNLYLATAVIAITFVAWVVRAAAAGKSSFRYNGVVASVAVIIAVFIISGLQNYEILLRDSPGLMKAIQFVMYTALFVLVYQIDFSKREISGLFVLILVMGTAQGVIGAIQYASNPGFFIIGLIGQHNIFAIHMAFIALVAMGVLLEARSGAVRFAALVAVAVTLYALAYSFSRTAYISIVISIATFTLLPIARPKKIAVAALAAALAIAAFTLVPAVVKQRVQDIMQTATGEKVALSFKFRLGMWREALADFAANPLIGRGVRPISLADNFYMKSAAETGIVGLGAFIALIYLTLRDSWRNLAAAPAGSFMRGVLVGFFPAALSSLAIFNLTGDFLATHGFIGIFWIALALVLRYPSAAA